MHTTERLPIRGYRDEPVPNEFLRQQGEARHLAVLLPGMGYTCDMPLFYYAETMLLDAGADVLRVEYAYGRRPDFRDRPEAEQRRWLFADATAALRAGLGQRSYPELTLVGKSLGTLAMGHVLTAASLPARTWAVWLTPLLRQAGFREQMRRHRGPALVAIGTADPHHDPTLLDEVRQATGAEVVVIADGDHSLDVPGDVAASIRAVEQVIGAMQAFLAR